MAEEKVMRAVVGEERKPFDRDFYGNPMYVYFDLLECGHKRAKNQPSLLRTTSNMTTDPPPKMRVCRKCTEEQNRER